uniref:Uncharacterized protein n=1 Tax=Nicotiana tabacum TaxID=4097 RepID=A0A1S4AHL9_TOBAC|nr:PREDICTED: uncharacterized protein LOC107797536 [Nicotiana tabacum]
MEAADRDAIPGQTGAASTVSKLDDNAGDNLGAAEVKNLKATVALKGAWDRDTAGVAEPTTDPATNAKNHEINVFVGQKSGIEAAITCSNVGATIALNITGYLTTVGDPKTNVAADIVGRSSGIKATVVHVEGQVSNNPRQNATVPCNSDTKSKKWVVVNKSTNKKQATGAQNHIVPSNVIGVSNSFDALVNEGEHVTKEAENTGQQMDDDTRSIVGKTSSTAMLMNTTSKNGQPQAPGSNSQQQTSTNTGDRIIISNDIILVDAQKAETLFQCS